MPFLHCALKRTIKRPVAKSNCRWSFMLLFDSYPPGVCTALWPTSAWDFFTAAGRRRCCFLSTAFPRKRNPYSAVSMQYIL